LYATFYHRGVSISPDEHGFSPVICSAGSLETVRITVTQLGNAPTGEMSVEIKGTNNDEFFINLTTIPSIYTDDDFVFDVGVCLGSTPQYLEGFVYTALLEIKGENTKIHEIPLNIRVNHFFPGFIYRNGFHDRRCTGCDFYNDEPCEYGSFSNHARQCSVCSGIESHTADWAAWTAWAQGTVQQHTRTRTCRHTGCGFIDNDSGSHNEATTGAWTHDATNHSRSRSCSLCNRFIRTETIRHNFTPWVDQGNGTHRRSCPDCNRVETPSHTWGNAIASWIAVDTSNVWSGFYHHRRPCTAAGCNALTEEPCGNTVTWIPVAGGHCHVRCTTPGCTAGSAANCPRLLNPYPCSWNPNLHPTSLINMGAGTQHHWQVLGELGSRTGANFNAPSGTPCTWCGQKKP